MNGYDDAICPNHNGLIGRERSEGDHDGKKYWCPVGKEVWQLGLQTNRMRAPLNYPKLGIV